MDQPSSGTVEALLASLDQATSPVFTLWVPSQLTWRGGSVRQDVAMAIIVDRLLGLDYMPDGFTEGIGGRSYRYKSSV